MTGKTQPIEQEDPRGARAIMIRTISILAAGAALAVLAAPVASAGTPKKPPSQKFIEIGTTETLDMNARGTAKGRSVGKVANLGAANDVSQLSLRNAQPKPRGIVVTKATDIASTSLRQRP